MLRMSFYDGTLKKEEAKEVIGKSSKPCVYTLGFTWKNPTTYKKPISKETAIKIIDEECYLNITEEEDFIHLNAFTSNDMF